MPGFFPTKTFIQGALPDCNRCKLYLGCRSPKMEVWGNGSSRILVVGSSPSHTDDSAGHPFAGKVGAYVAKVLSTAGQRIENCWVTNSIICHPSDDIEIKHVKACRPSLARSIRELKPHVIILLGEWPLLSLLPDVLSSLGSGIAKWRGQVIPHHGLGAFVCPVFDPTFVLFSHEDAPVVHEIFTQDIQRAVNCLRKKLPSPVSQECSIIVNEEKVANKLLELAGETGILAWDYETTCRKPEHDGAEIVSCSFCLNGDIPWAGLITDALKPLLSQVLKSKNLRKVASNLKFEDRWTRVKLGHPVTNWYWDTMLAAHVLDNRRGISGVKFQSFVRLGIEPYDGDIEYYIKGDVKGINRMKEAPVNMMLRYNAMDSLVEYHVMIDQRKEMGCDG